MDQFCGTNLLNNERLAFDLIELRIIDSMKGTVAKTTGSFYWVKGDDDQIYECRLKGNLRLRDYKFTNPVVVGDHVDISQSDSGDWVIHDIGERKNYIIRRSTKLSKQMHIIASNLDHAVLVATISHPKTYLEFIDRYLVTAGAYHIPAVLIFNKADLYDDEEMALLEGYMALYTDIGYPCFAISALEDENFDDLIELMRDKITLFSGYSGVGKSTLLNRIDPSLNLKTSNVSEAYQSGKHTTTFAEMHEVQGVGQVIDTPGIKGLGVIDIPKEEISHYFPEMLKVLEHCKFNNCTHIDEPKCAVKDKVEEGEIALSRYSSYLSIFDEEREKYR